MPRILYRPLTPAQQQLVVDNQRIVVYVVRHHRYAFFSRILGFEEARAVGMLELVKRASTFKPKLGGRKLGGYALLSIGTAIRRAAEAKMKNTSRCGWVAEETVSRELRPEVEAVLNEQAALAGVDRPPRRRLPSRSRRRRRFACKS